MLNIKVYEDIEIGRSIVAVKISNTKMLVMKDDARCVEVRDWDPKRYMYEDVVDEAWVEEWAEYLMKLVDERIGQMFSK